MPKQLDRVFATVTESNQKMDPNQFPTLASLEGILVTHTHTHIANPCDVLNHT